jgi:hypothetical protein
MHCAAVLVLASLVAGDVRDYTRPLDAKKLDQAAFDAEAYGDKKALKRGDDGLQVTVGPGGPETGWKTPQALKIGGDFTITARFTVRKLPKPAQDDGVAVGLAIATQNTDQPDAVLVRVIEPTGPDVYRSVEKAGNNPGQMQQNPQMMGRQPPGGGKPVKPPRKTFPARGESVVMEFRREGQVVQYSVLDGESDAPRYLGQAQIGSNDIAGVKLFASNRNGAEALDVVLRELTVRADRITGLGTEVRTVFGEVVHGDPTAIEGGQLVVGGPPKASNPPAPGANAGKPGAEPEKAAKPGEQAPKTDPATKPAAAATPGKDEKEDKSKPDDTGKPFDEPKDAAQGKGDNAGAKKDDAQAKDKAPEPGKSDALKEKEKGQGDAAAAKAAPPPKAEPKAKIQLDEVESIAFERALNVSGRVVGQPNLDFTMPRDKDAEGKEGESVAKADDVLAPPPGTVAPAKIPKLEPKPNGVRDVHLTLANLKASPIKQVTVNVQTDKGPTAWRLDTSDSKDWPLVLRRAGTETWADLFVEPPPGDIKGKDLTVNVTYQDGQNANATVKSEVSTDPKLAFDPKAPAPSFDARVYLAGGEQLFGRFEGLGEDSLRLQTPWGDELTVPLAHVLGVYMGLPDHKESSESFDRRLRSRGTDDLLLARSKDGEVVAIAGIAEKTEADRLYFRFQEKTRDLSLKQVEGLVLAARPEPERPDGLQATFSMAGGLVVSGRWASLDEKTWKVETAWGQVLALPAGEVRGVRFRGGQMTYLSDLEPSRAEETPYFGRRTPWRKDVNLAGGPLKMDGRTYERGLAVHSRSALTYDLGGRYATFEALVGFDELAGKAGRVDCRVFADDKEVYANPDLRADAPPVRLRLPVAGAERLRLVVDFGPDQDTGDRVIWADARVYRKPPPSAAADTPRPGGGTTERTIGRSPKTGGVE